MDQEEKQRMIHIRINDEVHRELRKVAAEFDLTMQEIVSRAVEQRIEALEAEAEMERECLKTEKRALDMKKQMMLRQARFLSGSARRSGNGLTDGEGSVDRPTSLDGKLESIEEKIGSVLLELSRLRELLEGQA